MSALTSPRGPLPARVYWVRRLLLLLTVFLLVFAASRLVGGDDEAETAAQTGADRGAPASDAAGDGEQAAPDQAGEQTGTGTDQAPTPTIEPTPTPPPLPEPSGPCPPEDVVVTPTVAAGIAADGLTINLELRTRTTEACTWTVSPETMTAKITSGPDDIWSSQQCPAAIPTSDVVVRNVEATVVPLVWNLRRSDADCSAQTDWARLGWYHVSTAALGGEPTSVQFELARQPQEVVTEEPADGKKAKGERSGDDGKKVRKPRQHRAGDDGDGTAEPNG